MFPKFKADIERLVTDAVEGQRASNFTFAQYMRVTLAYDSCKGFLLVLIPMPNHSEIAAELDTKRDIQLTLICTMVAACINASKRGGPEGKPVIQPGSFASKCEEPAEIEGVPTTVYAYQWVADSERS